MSSSKLHTLYKQLVRAFTSQPSDLKTSGRLLLELKVRSVCYTLRLTDASFYQVILIETGLIFPQKDYITQDLVIARKCFIDRYTHRQRRLINCNRGNPRNWGILEHTNERGPLLRSLLLSAADVLQ